MEMLHIMDMIKYFTKNIEDMRVQMEKSSNYRDVKRNNRIHTFQTILSCDRISQPALAAKLNHSGPTVLQNVKELIELGLVKEIGVFDSTGGRKARAFAPVANARIALGLEITKTHVGIAAVDLTGEMIGYEQKKKDFSMGDAYFKYLSDVISQFIQTEAFSSKNILGVGISLPGIVEHSGQALTYSHVLHLRNIHTENFSRYICFPCSFMNDANAAGLAEVYGQEDLKHLVYLSLNNSVGGAILIKGKLYAGEHVRAGEVGHNTLIPGGKTCYCGKQGCVDAYCNAEVLSSLAGGSLVKFFDKLHEGDDAQLAEVWEEYLSHLAVVVNNLHMTFDCNVMLGGYVGSFLKEYGGELRERLANRNPFGQDASYLKFCRHKVGASAIGAALLWVERFIKSI